MSILEQESFISSIHPFENLTSNQLETFVENIDIVYFKENEIVQKQDSEPTHLYFVLKGLIQEKKEDEVLSLYSRNEIFDSISLIENFSKNSFSCPPSLTKFLSPKLNISASLKTSKPYCKNCF